MYFKGATLMMIISHYVTCHVDI